MIREALAGGADFCATFSLSGKSEHWVQFVDGTVNAAYPLAEEPSALIVRMENALLESWEPHQYLTVKLSLADARSISNWIAQYFEEVLGAFGDYSLDASVEQL